MPIDIKQINQDELSGYVSGVIGKTYRSILGNAVAYTDNTNQTISGFKTFQNPPNVPYAGTTGQVPSQKYVNDRVNLASGALLTRINAVSGQNFFYYRGDFVPGDIYLPHDSTTYQGSTYGYTGIVNFAGGSPSGNWHILAASGTQGISGISGAIGPIGNFNFINSGTLTGSFFDSSFFIDIPYTGLNIMEAFVSHSGVLTGYVLGCNESGTSNGPLSGCIYLRDTVNVKNNVFYFNMNTGELFQTGAMTVNFNPLDRIGIDLYYGIDGMKGLTIGVLGIEWGG